jgi:hypothetical protein
VPDDLALMAEVRRLAEAIGREPAVTLIPAGLNTGSGQPGEFELHTVTQIAN